MDEEQQQSALESTDTLVSHYLVELAGQLYALPQSSEITLSWIQRAQEPTYLPTLPSWCLGLVNERNRPVLLVDLRAVLGLPPSDLTQPNDHARHVFVESAGDTLGFLVDRTHRFRLLRPAAQLSLDALVSGVVESGTQRLRTLHIDAIWRHIVQELSVSQEPSEQAAV